jgi:hypothetical protein
MTERSPTEVSGRFRTDQPDVNVSVGCYELVRAARRIASTTGNVDRELERSPQRVVNEVEILRRKVSYPAEELTFRDRLEATRADDGRDPKPSAAPVLDNDVTNSRASQEALIAGDHADHDVSAGVERGPGHDAQRPGLRALDVCKRERAEVDLAFVHSAVGSARNGDVVVDPVLFREPIDRRQGREIRRRSGPAQELLAKLPEPGLGRLDSLLRASHHRHVESLRISIGRKLTAGERLVGLDGSPKLLEGPDEQLPLALAELSFRPGRHAS